MQTAFVLFNPVSGSYSPRKVNKILEMLRDADIAVQPLLPRSEDEAKSIVRGLCMEFQRPLIIAAGGDGTVNTVINGMVEKSAVLGIIPLGTANVLARELGITSLSDAVARISKGTARAFSVGKAETPTASRLFMLMAGIGIDGEIVAGVRKGEKRWLGRIAYFLSALRQIAAWNRRAVTISKDEHSDTCHSVIVANASHYGGPFVIAPKARIFSASLDIVPLSIFSRYSFVRFALPFLAKGKVSPLQNSWQMHDGCLFIHGEKAIQVDGDYFDKGPVKISIVTDFNELLV